MIEYSLVLVYKYLNLDVGTYIWNILKFGKSIENSEKQSR